MIFMVLRLVAKRSKIFGILISKFSCSIQLLWIFVHMC